MPDSLQKRLPQQGGRGREKESKRREVIFMLTVLRQCLWHVAVAVVAVIACGMSCLSLKIVFIMPSALSIAALRSL